MFRLLLHLVADDHRRKYRRKAINSEALAIEPLSPDFLFDYVALQIQADKERGEQMKTTASALASLFGA